jgi:hypothetical protein
MQVAHRGRESRNAATGRYAKLCIAAKSCRSRPLVGFAASITAVRTLRLSGIVRPVIATTLRKANWRRGIIRVLPDDYYLAS